jgi:glutamate/tyrosine decarboxylase-like PLP-dependent enzyme
MTTQATSALLEETAQRAVQFLANLEHKKVFPDQNVVQQLRDYLDTPLPEHGTEPSQVISQLDQYASPATVASAGGRYFGFVTGGALPASLAANWLAGAWDQNGLSPVSSPAVALLEETALRWLKDVLLIPDEAEGAFTTGATMANFTCLAAARHQVLQQVGWDVEAAGLLGAPNVNVVIGDQVHGTVLKVLAMLGFGRERVIRVPADAQGRMRADCMPDLQGPTILCIQAGNVNSGAFDPASEIMTWAREHNAWVHVDGAFGLWAAAVPELQHLVAGYEQADSWASDCHKWLNVPFDCGIAFIRDREAQTLAKFAQNLPIGEIPCFHGFLFG